MKDLTALVLSTAVASAAFILVTTSAVAADQLPADGAAHRSDVAGGLVAYGYGHSAMYPPPMGYKVPMYGPRYGSRTGPSYGPPRYPMYGAPTPAPQTRSKGYAPTTAPAGREHGAEPSAGPDSEAASASDSATVAVQGMRFQPAEIRIKAGETVIWQHRDRMPHTVTSRSSSELSSPTLNGGASFSNRFDEPGTYDYYCSLHPSMTGRVVVE